MEYLSSKAEKGQELKREELDLRKKELELAEKKQDQAFEQQQNLMATMMSQI